MGLNVDERLDPHVVLEVVGADPRPSCSFAPGAVHGGDAIERPFEDVKLGCRGAVGLPPLAVAAVIDKDRRIAVRA